MTREKTLRPHRNYQQRLSCKSHDDILKGHLTTLPSNEAIFPQVEIHVVLSPAAQRTRCTDKGPRESLPWYSSNKDGNPLFRADWDSESGLPSRLCDAPSANPCCT